MKIGIDCRPLMGNKTGIGNYLWEILNEWAKLKIEHELFLYAPDNFNVPDSFIKANIKFRKRIYKSRFYEVWKHTILPFQLALDNIDVYWGPNYAQPYVPIPIPTILTVHDIVYIKYPDTLKKSTLFHNRLGLESYLINVNKILVPSYTTKLDLINELQVNPDNIVVTKLGISDIYSDLIEIENNDKGYNDHENKYILTVSTIEPRKNIQSIIDAYKIISLKHSDLKLIIVGGRGWGKMDIISDEKKGIYYLGYISDKELAGLYKKALIFIYIPLYEGFGLPPLEAMKAGVPVIASNKGALMETVNKYGLLVDPTDIYEIADKINYLIENSDVRNSMVEAAKRYAGNMNWKTTAIKTLTEIIKVVNDN